MKIISNDIDIYDHFSRNPQISDRHYIYNRQKVEIKQPNLPTWPNLHSTETGYIDFCILGFCGEVYPFIAIPGNNCFYYQYNDELESLISRFYSGFVKVEKWFNKQAHGIYRFSISKGDIFKSLIGIDLHRKYNAPYWVLSSAYQGTTLEINPVLESIHFYRVLSPWEMFTRIERFLSNELAPQDTVDYQPTDVLKVQSHGFTKESFRKEKGA